MYDTTIFWFTNDLRLSDNTALQQAALRSQHLLCVFCLNPANSRPNRAGRQSMGVARKRFLQQSLADLQQQLRRLGQTLLVVEDDPLSAMEDLIDDYPVSAIYRSVNAGYDENQYWQLLQRHFPHLAFHQFHTHTLFKPTELPFDVSALPKTFTQFRKQVETLPVAPPLGEVAALPPPPQPLLDESSVERAKIEGSTSKLGLGEFCGGASAGTEHLAEYFSGTLPAHYKKVRNDLDGWRNSSKLSPWLALGCISPREVAHALQAYERTRVANESTYWLYFELLWREYFQWYAHCHEQKIFAFGGIVGRRPLTSFYSERFNKWCGGQTPYPLVNACMNQLKDTGYISNRARQIAASCLVNELAVDWRFGAAYFEEQLVDYDVATNWGNWQYIAGVGADPRGGRRFDLAKQAARYDSEGEYVRRWRGGDGQLPLDSVDYHDWPVG